MLERTRNSSKLYFVIPRLMIQLFNALISITKIYVSPEKNLQKSLAG